MKLKITFLIISIFTFHFIANFCFGYGKVNHNSISVSLMDLIVNPDKYHGKLVRVIGVSHIAFEGNGIWFSLEHYNHRLFKNSLWIEPDYEVLKVTKFHLAMYNGKYVLIEGVFNKNDYGHMGMNSGSIERISRFQPWGPFKKRKK